MIRQAKPLDNYAIANIIVSGWKTAYKGLINDEFLDNLSVDIKAENWKNIILSQNENNHIYIYEENNEILGVIRFGKPDENYNNYNAEIHVLYVKPALKRKGIGTKLFNFAKKYFLEQNTNQMIIWCLNNNIPSIKFYEKMGGTVVDTRKAIVNNIELEEVGIAYTLTR